MLGVELHGDAFLCRNRSGAPYSSDTLGDDFRDVRHVVFGPEETRTLADFRRSGAQERRSPGTPSPPADTYNPVNMASVRKVHEARIMGRRRLREAGRTARPALGRKAERGTE